MFWHQLALRLGSTIHHLKTTMTMREFTSWVAFNNLSPISDDRGDYQAAQITGMIYSANSGKDSPKMNIEDFKLFKQKTKQDLIIDGLNPIEREFYNSFNK